jgi:hypothetical protein
LVLERVEIHHLFQYVVHGEWKFFLVVSIETLHEAFKEWKLFYPIPTTKHCKSTVGMEVFWHFKDVLLNDELVVMVLDQGDLTMDGVNNFVKKRISYKDDSLPDGLQLENIIDFENMGNAVQDLCNEELQGEGSYTSEDDVQGPACKSSFDSKSKKGSEDDIGEGDEEARVQENFERHEMRNQQVMGVSTTM